jgi:hypothetical protein
MGDDRDKAQAAAQADLELSDKEAEDVKGGSAEAKRRKKRKKGGSGGSGSATNKPM